MKFLSLSREFSRRTDKFQDLGFPLVSMTEFIGGKVLPNSSYEQECGFPTFHVGNDFHTDLAYILAQLLQEDFLVLPQSHQGFTRQPENSKREHLRVPVFKTPPKFNEKTPREGRKERILRRSRGRAVPGRAVPGRAVPGRAVPGRAVPGRAFRGHRT